MPLYKVYCQKCGFEKEIVCPIAERNKQRCDQCGGNMKVWINTANVLSRGIPLRTRSWMRKRDL